MKIHSTLRIRFVFRKQQQQVAGFVEEVLLRTGSAVWIHIGVGDGIG